MDSISLEDLEPRRTTARNFQQGIARFAQLLFVLRNRNTNTGILSSQIIILTK